MSSRRSKALPIRPGKEKQNFDLNSLDIVDLATDVSTQTATDKVALEKGKGDPAEILEAEELFGDESLPLSLANSTRVAENETKPLRKFASNVHEHRIFGTATQEKIGRLNAGQIRRIQLSVVLSGVALVVLFVCLSGIYITRTDRNAVDEVQVSTADEPGVVNLGADFAKHVIQSKDVVSRFLKAKSLDERLLYVRHPKKVVTLMQNDKSLDWGAPLPFSGPEHYQRGYVRENFLTGLFVQDDEFRQYTIDIEVKGDRYLIDWESFAEYNEYSWSEMKESCDPEIPYVVRALLRIDDYYNSELFNRQDYQCFHISNRTESESMFVYARRGGWVEKAFRDLLRNIVLTEGVASAMTQMVQIELQFPEEKLIEPMAEISSFIAPHWFTLDPDADSFDYVNPSAILGTLATEEEVPYSPKVIDWDERDRLKKRSQD